MLSLNKKQALKMRDELLSLSVVLLDGKSYGYELLHQSGKVFTLWRIDSPNRLTCTQLDTAKALADYLKFDRFGVRIQETTA